MKLGETARFIRDRRFKDGALRPPLVYGHPLREVKEYLRKNPGAHLSEIERDLDLKNTSSVMSKYARRGALKRTGDYGEYRYWLNSADTGAPAERVAYNCPVHETALVLKKGARGYFWGCPTYAETDCRFTMKHKPAENKNGPVVIKQTASAATVATVTTVNPPGNLKWLQDEVKELAASKLMDGRTVSLLDLPVMELIEYERRKNGRES